MSWLVLAVALSISAVAAYYSIVGLVAIFAASAVPIVIMGTVLEIGKLVTTVWLHRYWKQTRWWLKTYLTTAVVVLMLITSMGIFGFLSKAHIQQSADAEQSQSQIVRIDEQIQTQKTLLNDLQNSNVNSDEKINAQIASNQKQIEQIISRYDALVEEQNVIIREARANLNLLEKYISEQDIEALQTLIGAKVDGKYGPGTASRVERFREIETAKSTPILDGARQEIAILRGAQEGEVRVLAEANSRLQQQIGTVSIDQDEVDRLQRNVLQLQDEKFKLETEYRKLEAEFGPVQYISELIYGEADKTQLDDAVRIVIMMLIFVFDPLAVLLLIASQTTMPKRATKQWKPNTVTKVNTRFEEVELDVAEFEEDQFTNDTVVRPGKLKGFKPDV
jgi:peptidoglycan hydrolase-like protein with peptidoglycan-binding domain